MKRHKHPGKYISKTPRGRYAWKRRPVHRHRRNLIDIKTGKETPYQWKEIPSSIKETVSTYGYLPDWHTGQPAALETYGKKPRFSTRDRYEWQENEDYDWDTRSKRISKKAEGIWGQKESMLKRKPFHRLTQRELALDESFRKKAIGAISDADSLAELKKIDIRKAPTIYLEQELRDIYDERAEELQKAAKKTIHEEAADAAKAIKKMEKAEKISGKTEYYQTDYGEEYPIQVERTITWNRRL